MKRSIEIEDTLDERADNAIEAVKQELLAYLEQNPDTDELPCLSNDLDYSGTIHEIVDSSVPIRTLEIETQWFLYGGSLEEAYKNAGIGENPRENYGMTAIYCYIMERVNDWYHHNAEKIFNEWKEKKNER